MQKTFIFLTILIAVCFWGFTASHAGAYKLPDTGQSKCYDDQGEISCPEIGQPFYGQDSQYQGAEPAYQDNGDGTVTDLNTGFMWQKGDSQNVGQTRFWQQAVNYCQDLSLADHNDWRLPNRRELVSLIYYGRVAPAVDLDSFPECQRCWYWSNTDVATSTGWAWLVSFEDGAVYYSEKALEPACVRCIRGSSMPPVHYIIHGDGTVTDRSTGFRWQQEIQTVQSWEEALEYCESQTLGGYDDWMLPNIRQLESLVDWTRVWPAINPIFSTSTFGAFSSTSDVAEAGHVWTVRFQDGRVGIVPKTNSWYLLCVRNSMLTASLPAIMKLLLLYD